MSEVAAMTVGHRCLDHVWVVNRTEEVDGLYVFQDEHTARAFARRYADAAVTEEVVMNQAAAHLFLIDTAEDDGADESAWERQ